MARHATYDGRANQTSLRAPKADGRDAEVTIDGSLDEPIWRDAAVLTGFSLYAPIDQRPAPDSTEVLVWYSSTAIYFGIRGFEPHGGGDAVHATLADRDRISGDDNVEIHLDTFHDQRRAFVFIVNPLGVQADGMKSEAGGFIPGSNVMPGQNDLSADFIWQSKGRVTPWGFQVEIRIPLKSLRFAARDVQDWGLQIQRNVQHSGYQETWTPARKASASFLAQEGTIVGLTGMHHGEVLELNPELTSTTAGAPQTLANGAAGAWGYEQSATLGGNVKWGMTSNFVLNGTIKPDFSQVEADATQIASDLRFALFYPEKRPFFVEGSDQFNVPNTLVYTRQIVHPTDAAKITGKVGGTDLALLSAVDDPQVSRTPGSNPIATILRVRRDFSGQSTAGVLVSDREEGSAFNRLAGGDVRFVFGRLYFAQFQAVASTTRLSDTTRTGPMWEAVLDRTGRAFGFHYNIIGIHPDFAAWNGFVPRTGYVQPSVSNRFTIYGRPGSVFERYNVFITTNALWRYDDFFSGKSLLESKASASNQFLLHGGWSLNLNPTLASFAFDPAQYAGLVTVAPPGPGSPQLTPFVPSPRITTFVIGTSVNTPIYQEFDASVSATGGNDVDFSETSRVHRFDAGATANWRPTEKVRVNASYVSSMLTRRADDRITTFIRIPRIKVEYQLARPVFVRFVGQYTATTTGDTLVRDPRTGLPLTTIGSLGPQNVERLPSTAFRVDWLFSYRPTPGTVFFVGYGSSLTEDDPLAFSRLRRVNDAFFVKASYLLRM
ncbi:MAG TPA: DUF5916 domain-containing protein [Gemmatimonadaceae bacterium]